MRKQFSCLAVTAQAVHYATSKGRKFRLIQSASILILIVEQLLNHTIVKDKTSEKLFPKDSELKPICSLHTTFYIKLNNSHERF